VKTYVRLATNTSQHLQLFMPCDKKTLFLAVLLEFRVLVFGVKTLGLTFGVFRVFFLAGNSEISPRNIATIREKKSDVYG
jgi:hypothetical protein